MKAEELKELGYSLINEYTCGKWDNLVMNVYRNKRFRVYISYHKKTGKAASCYITIGKINLKELTQLDKILNK